MLDKILKYSDIFFIPYSLYMFYKAYISKNVMGLNLYLTHILLVLFTIRLLIIIYNFYSKRNKK